MQERKFEAALVATAIFHAQFKIGMLFFTFYRDIISTCVGAAKEIHTEWNRPCD